MAGVDEGALEFIWQACGGTSDKKVGNHWYTLQWPALCLTCRLKDPGVALAIPRGKRLHHAVDLLGFTWQTETPQELPTIRGKGGGFHLWCHREDVAVVIISCAADRSAWTRLRSANSCSSTKACSTLMLKSSLVIKKKDEEISFPILFYLWAILFPKTPQRRFRITLNTMWTQKMGWGKPYFLHESIPQPEFLFLSIPVMFVPLFIPDGESGSNLNSWPMLSVSPPRGRGKWCVWLMKNS